MSPITALEFVLLGAAIVVLDVALKHRHPLSHRIAFGAAVLALLPLVGYLYGSPFHLGLGRDSDMAALTAAAFLIAAAAIVFIRLNHDLATLLVSQGPGAFMARRPILPIAVFLLALGWIRTAAERHALVSSSFGTRP